MLPRSDKAYVAIVVTVASVIVLLSIIGTIKALTGDAPQRPAYESAPAPALVPPSDSGIVDLANTQRPPISDADYLKLHRGTRLLASQMLTADWKAQARKAGASENAISGVSREISSYQQTTRGLKGSAAKEITINRPVGGRSRTGATVRYTGTDAQGAPLEETLISYDFFWRQDKTGAWSIYDITTAITGGASTEQASPTGDGDGSSETGPAPEQPEPDSYATDSGDGVS